jgi:outer membrane lipoprotein-sorting protein
MFKMTCDLIMRTRVHLQHLCIGIVIVVGSADFSFPGGKTAFYFAGAAQGNQEMLEQVLSQLEAVGKSFRSFSADFAQKKYTAVLKEFDTPESGEFYYARAKDGSALLRQEVVSPGKRILTIKGGIATIYNPVIKQAQVVNLGKNKDKAEYLALGLGQSPAKLQATFEIEYKGMEQVGGIPCSVLLLKPKSASVSAYFSAITLWIKKETGVPIQQKLQEPSGDYLLVNFSKERLNVKIPDAKFELQLPSGIEIQRF